MDGKKFNKLAKVSKSRKMGKIMVDEDVMGQDPLKGYPFQKKFSVEQSFRNMVETSNLNLSEDDGEGGRFDKSPSEMTPKQRKAKADHDQALRDRDARKKARVAQMQKDKAHADTPAEKERRKKDREKNLRAVGAKGGETHRDYVKRTGGTQTNSFDPQAESNEFNTYRNMIDMWEENLQEDLQEEMISYRVKGMQKPEEQKFIRSAKMMGLKITMDKGSKDTVIVMSGTKKKLRDFDAVARGKSSYGDPSTIKHFDEETVSEGKKIQDIVRKHKRELQKAQRSGNLDLSKKAEDELSNWASSSGEIRGDDEDEFIDWLDSNLDDLVKGKIKESTISEAPKLKNLMPEFEKIVKTKGAAKVQGTMVDMFTASVIVKAYAQVNDNNKKRMETSNVFTLIKLAQKVMGMKEELQLEEAHISTILEKAYDENDVKKVQQLEKKLQGMLKEVDKTMKGSGLSAPAFNNVRSGIQKGLESIQKFYKIARK